MRYRFHRTASPEAQMAAIRAADAIIRPSAYCVNTSRGRIVDEAALTRALREGWIAGAGLDVLTQEPPAADNPLLTLANAVVIPHAGGFSDEVVDQLPRLAVEEVLAVLRGGMPRPIAWADRAAFAPAE